MAFGRLVPIIGLFALLSFVPGALGHCGFSHGDSSTSQPGFSTQTAPAPPSAVAMIAFIAVPIAVVGGALALVKSTPAKSATGKWVATPDRWEWVPDKK